MATTSELTPRLRATLAWVIEDWPWPYRGQPTEDMNQLVAMGLVSPYTDDEWGDVTQLGKQVWVDGERAKWIEEHDLGAAYKRSGMTRAPRSGLGVAASNPELPSWPGASAVYSYLYGVLDRLGAANWRQEAEQARKQRRKPRAPAPTEEMKTIIQALDKGDEEELKYIHMQYKTGGRVYEDHAAAREKVMSRRQPSLPGFPDIPDPIEIRIPTMPWTQIGGDMDPGAHGGTIATADGDHIELLKIQPVREYIGDKEATDVGFPFWTKEAWFDLADLDPKNEEVKSALDSIDMSLDTLEADFTPEQRGLVIAEALLDWGRGDEGPAGWSKDLPDYDVKWQTGKVVNLRDYLADEDDEFRQEVLGWGDIQSALEEMVQKMVDQSAATGWSHVDDQTADDLEGEGFDPKSIVVIAEFGDAVAVNEDIEREKTFAGISAELEAEGYEYIDKSGGRVPSTEGYAYGEHVIRAVAKEMDVEEDIVTEAAEALDWWQEEIPGSSSGQTYVYAKRKAGGAEEAPRRTRRRR